MPTQNIPIYITDEKYETFLEKKGVITEKIKQLIKEELEWARKKKLMSFLLLLSGVMT